MRWLIGLFTLLVLSGCSGRNKTAVKDKEEKENVSVEIVRPDTTGYLLVPIVQGKAELSIRKKENQTLTLGFQSSGYKRLTGELSSKDSLANIRFTQIFMPDGTADGPFGREIQYELKQDGLYKLSIHENMMAGDPWTGIFTVKIKLDL